MDYKLTGLAKKVIILNIVLSFVIGAFHIYNFSRVSESNQLISQYLDEHNVTQGTAIRQLKREGVEIVTDSESSAVGILMCLASIVFVIIFSKKNTFAFGLLAGMMCTFASVIGGFALFYVLFSGKSQR